MPTNNNPFSTEVLTEWKPDKSIKILNLPNNGACQALLYGDFQHRFYLQLNAGAIALLRYDRINGKMQLNNGSKIIVGNPSYHNIVCLAQYCNITAIPTSEIESLKYDACCSAYPYYGYIAWYCTENNEKHFIRLYISDYKLDNAGNLCSVEIQYQQIS